MELFFTEFDKFSTKRLFSAVGEKCLKFYLSKNRCLIFTKQACPIQKLQMPIATFQKCSKLLSGLVCVPDFMNRK
jgi:hypothetical protein